MAFSGEFESFGRDASSPTSPTAAQRPVAVALLKSFRDEEHRMSSLANMDSPKRRVGRLFSIGSDRQGSHRNDSYSSGSYSESECSDDEQSPRDIKQENSKGFRDFCVQDIGLANYGRWMITNSEKGI
ncbi:putative adenosylhomocysteinase 3 [Corticium candelabrum]|uniref:putative adenosylhomocysteinase 3 n=1 Tax=Corticium candelabrum TaxID=121492 RepID=UPI002E26AF1F|nr:putative adenosylhomocysteinase 3 [Corticium candelabrum]